MSQGKQETVGRVIGVAMAVCLVCSIVVSGAAVTLRPAQATNKELDRKRNILVAAGMLEEGRTQNSAGRGIDDLFGDFEARVVDLQSGEFVEDVDPSEFDQLRAARDPERSRALSDAEDTATISRLEQRALVYLTRESDGDIDKLVLPIRGYGLWGTLFGYLVLDGDLRTVAGVSFYEHKETPGLGGEVENPQWKASWQGVKVYDDSWEPRFEVTKSPAPDGTPAAQYEVDALSGATLTSRGVQNLVNFWVGDLGFGPMIDRLRQQRS